MLVRTAISTVKVAKSNTFVVVAQAQNLVFLLAFVVFLQNHGWLRTKRTTMKRCVAAGRTIWSAAEREGTLAGGE